MVPDALINPTARILPWLELIMGIYLLFGLVREGTAWAATLLLVLFSGAVVFSLYRGMGIYFGCFHTGLQGVESAAMGWYVFRDRLFIIPACHLLYRTFLSTPEKTGESKCHDMKE